MKKLFSLFIIACLLLLSLSGCAKNMNPKTVDSSKDAAQTVTSDEASVDETKDEPIKPDTDSEDGITSEVPDTKQTESEQRTNKDSTSSVNSSSAASGNNSSKNNSSKDNSSKDSSSNNTSSDNTSSKNTSSNNTSSNNAASKPKNNQSAPSAPSVPSVPSTPSSSSQSGGAPDSYTGQENREVLNIVNAERAKEGLAALSYRSDLQEAADIRAREIVKLFSHTRPDGTNCFTAVKEAGISYRTVGENIAYGYRNAEVVMTGWMNSSGHRANILNGNFTGLAVGLYEKNNIKYWVQIFVG